MSASARLTLWCCSAFLDHNTPDGADYYDLLSISRGANPAQIKSAYKKKSLAMHPDKLAQQGRELTDDDRTQFVKMKDAYETLINPRTRAVYDSLGEKGYNWYNDPMSIDRKEIFHNFCTSSIFDRSKILLIFLFFFTLLTLPAILFCVRADGNISSVPYSAILTPLWLIYVFLFYVHIKSILLPTAEPPEDDPNWVDPFPRSVRFFDFLTFLSQAVFVILGVGKLDGWDDLPYGVVFTPYFIYETIKFFTSVRPAFLGVISIEEIEEVYNKSVFDMTPEERAEVDAVFTIIAPTASQEYRDGIKKKSAARSTLVWSFTRTMIAIFIVLNLSDEVDWSYWLVFTPFWVVACCTCCFSCGSVMQTNGQLMKLDEEDEEKGGDGTQYGTMDDEGERLEKLTPEERAELKAILSGEAQDSLSTCCSVFFLTGFVALLVGKFAGADYSSIWIIFPFLFFVGVLFCCICSAIFGANEEAFKQAEEEDFGAGPYGGAAGAPPATSTPEMTLDDLKGKDIQSMKVKEMKMELRLRGVKTDGMVEKGDLVKGLTEAREGRVGEEGGEPAAAAAPPAGVFNMPYVPPEPLKKAEPEPVKEDDVKVDMDGLD